MNLRDARVGYAGYSRDFSVPGDRRRFTAYARIKGIPVEYAELNGPYDLAYVTYSSDLPGWVARKRREGDRFKLLFELIDSYLTQTSVTRRVLKGTARRLLGTDSRLSPDLQRTLIAACSAADGVICSTKEQCETIRRYNPNVFISFDHFADELGAPKQDYGRAEKLKIVWEGQSTTLPNIQAIREVLNDLRRRIELHVVTDPLIHRWFGRFGAHPAQDALNGIECDIVFHPWRRESFCDDIVAADVAIIPIDPSNTFACGKPENKLVMFWQLGLPVLTSATPAYSRAMSAAPVAEMICQNAVEWSEQLERLIAADSARLEAIGRKCRAFAGRAYSKERFLSRFDDAFEAIGFSTD